MNMRELLVKALEVDEFNLAIVNDKKGSQTQNALALPFDSIFVSFFGHGRKT